MNIYKIYYSNRIIDPKHYYLHLMETKMGTILSGISSDDLLPALEANMIAFWKPYGRVELDESPELVRFISGSPFSLFNGMMGARLRAEQVDTIIEESCQACIKHQVPAQWWVGPNAQPNDLGARLERHGFENAGMVPGMAVDLNTMRDVGRLANGATVERVTDPGLIQAWAETAWVATGFPADQAGLFSEIETQMGIDTSGIRCRYAGYWKGKLVGTSVLVMNNGVAGIYAVSTLPEARGHGLGTALTIAPLRDALEAGYRVGTLQASEMGYPIYRRLGFQEVCQFALYLWENR
jgi:GNAT superfamily N-acetyltransferase